MSNLLTNSRMSCFRSCPRKHYLRYELGLQPLETSFALRVGSAFHAALEAEDNGEDFEAALQTWMSDPFDLALVAAMYVQYRAFWADHPLEVIATELPFDIPLLNPETGRPTPNWRLAGKVDRIVRLSDGRLALMEYKTTTRDVSAGSDYWVALQKDQQISIYVIAARALGYPVETVLYDVTQRPLQRPKKATPVEDRRYRKADNQLYVGQRETDETPEEFCARVSSTIAETPGAYFQRQEIARLDQDIEECQFELWQQQLSIRAMQKGGGWYRNPNACFEPFKCDYLAVCSNRDIETNTPQGFQRVANVHPELEVEATSPG